MAEESVDGLYEELDKKALESQQCVWDYDGTGFLGFGAPNRDGIVRLPEAPTEWRIGRASKTPYAGETDELSRLLFRMCRLKGWLPQLSDAELFRVKVKLHIEIISDNG